MDWHSWLSNTNLDPPLIYDYALSFSRNQLQKEDLSYFNHEFLQSMGISVAKHRLEILKLAKKDAPTATANGHAQGLTKLLSKTMKRFNKYVTNKLGHHHAQPKTAAMTTTTKGDRYKGGGGFAIARQCNSEKEVMKVDQPIPRLTRKVAKSGPLDMRAQEKLMDSNARNLKHSGPLDRKMDDRLLFSYRSPILSGPLDRKMDDRLLFSYRSPILSGPLDMSKSPRLCRAMVSRPLSPKFYTEEQKLGYNGVDYGDQSLWAALFQDMKPT